MPRLWSRSVRVKMPVMHIRVMRVAMRLRLMRVHMVVWLTAIPSIRMFMLVMRIMPVAVAMCERLVHMRVFMAFVYVQPDTQCHQQRGQPEQGARQGGPKCQGNNKPEERGNRKVGTGTRRTQCSQRKDKQDQA